MSVAHSLHPGLRSPSTNPPLPPPLLLFLPDKNFEIYRLGIPVTESTPSGIEIQLWNFDSDKYILLHCLGGFAQCGSMRLLIVCNFAEQSISSKYPRFGTICISIEIIISKYFYPPVLIHYRLEFYFFLFFFFFVTNENILSTPFLVTFIKSSTTLSLNIIKYHKKFFRGTSNLLLHPSNAQYMDDKQSKISIYIHIYKTEISCHTHDCTVTSNRNNERIDRERPGGRVPASAGRSSVKTLWARLRLFSDGHARKDA